MSASSYLEVGTRPFAPESVSKGLSSPASGSWRFASNSLWVGCYDVSPFLFWPSDHLVLNGSLLDLLQLCRGRALETEYRTIGVEIQGEGFKEIADCGFGIAD